MSHAGPGHKGQHRARKRFGQNFLRDQGIIERIVDAVQPLPNDHLVEIGPGQGAITSLLLGSGCTLDVIELDRDLVPRLRSAYGHSARFTLHSADALRFDFASLVGDGPALRVVGNLPYNISTPLIFRLLEQASLVADMHFMLQKEVVQRLAAAPGNKNYGRLGIMAQYLCRVEALFEVPPEAFSPRPKVDSAVVRLVPYRDTPWPACDRETLQKVVQAAFAQRRKTLRNTLKGLIDANGLAALGIDPGARAETLTLENFIAIANDLDEAT